MGFLVSCGTWERCRGAIELFAYGAFTLSGGSFQKPSAKLVVCNFLTRLQLDQATFCNPAQATLASYYAWTVWAVLCSLVATDGIAFAFFFWGY